MSGPSLAESQQQASPSFLAGGGEMGARMRAFDWTSTPLGSPAMWPQSLKTIIRVMLDSRYAMWMFWGPEYTFFCNDAYLPTVGLKRDWVLGARADLVWAEIWPDINPRIESVLTRGEATWDEALLLFLERSGFTEETYHTFSYSPIYNDSSDIAGMLCVVTEVTDRVIGERRLHLLRDLAARSALVETVQQSCERLCDVLDNYPYDIAFSAIYIIDTETASANRAAISSSIECDEQNFPTVLPLDMQTPWPVHRLVVTASLQDIDLANIKIEASAPLWPDRISLALLIPFEDTAHHHLNGFVVVGMSPRRPLDDAYRSFVHLIANQIGAAIASAQAYEAECRRAQALAELDRAKTVFFSNVSHEFRTPLTLMLGPIETLLADCNAAPQMRDQLELAHRNSLRLLKLVNSLLDFSRIEAGRVNVNYEPTELAALTRDIASTFRSTMESAGLQFDVRCSTLRQPVYVDREMWEKIILNLLSNAFKFTLQGSIELCLFEHSNCAVLEIEDTGVGIPSEDLPKIFERFHRVEKTQGRTHEGSGIGLALVNELIALHGGSINVNSQVGVGSRFRIEVPFGSQHLPPDKIGAGQTLFSVPQHAHAFVEEAMRWLPDDPRAGAFANAYDAVKSDRRFANTFGARIVVADDNADMRTYISSLLSPFYRVETVVDGLAVIAAAHRQIPDLILSDVMMPRLDGFGLLASLRADVQLRDVPLILLSARAGEDARIEGFDAGADDYLAKPFSAREMLTRVGALLELTRMRRDSEARARQVLLDQQQRLQAADTQKDQFLAMLAHELRNPLAPIDNACELLSLLVEPNSKAHDATRMIKRQMIHLTRLVDDLLDVSRITQGRIELQLENIDIVQVIMQAIEAAEPLLRNKNQQLVTKSTYELPLRIDGDLTRLVQCLVNIVTNAVKYTHEGGQISVDLHAENDFAVIEVADDGAGIPSELLPHVFDLFVQGERTLDRSLGGLGIGLSVVKGLVEMHGGSVAAFSAGTGHGSTFTIRLPLSQKVPAVFPKREKIDSISKRILLVDDNMDAANSLATLLTLAGHTTHAVGSGCEALQCLDAFKPDIAILDIGLPQMDGYELAAALRKLPHMQALKLVALTGYGQASDREQARQVGFDQHLVKPIDFELLRMSLETI